MISRRFAVTAALATAVAMPRPSLADGKVLVIATSWPG